MPLRPLTVTGLSKRFGTQVAVRSLSFAVEPGEIFGIVGPNGAGKTTTVKSILGLLIPDGGAIELFGKRGNGPAVRQRIGYMPETPSFYAHLTGRELLRFAGELFGLSRGEISARSDELLERVGLSEAAHRQLGTYSKGMLQRIGLAQALVNRPELLFLDEPMDGLDPIGRIRMREVLAEIKAAGTAIVLNSHILSDVEMMSDRVAIMDRGELLALEKTAAMVPKGTTLEDVFIGLIERHGS